MSTSQALKALLMQTGSASAAWIARSLDVGEDAVMQAANELRAQGCGVDISADGRVRLDAPAGSMWPCRIRASLNSRWAGQRIEYYDVTSSTNAVARDLAEAGAPHGTLVIADLQTQGRGRMTRSWVTRSGDAALMSLIVRPNGVAAARSTGIVLATALAIAYACRALGIDARVKWPNDIIVGGKKVCGMLLDTELAGDMMAYGVIGIGLNINGSPSGEGLQHAACLRDAVGHALDRAVVVARCLEAFEARYEAWSAGGLEAIRADYEARCLTLGRRVRVIGARETFEGQALGLCGDGALTVRRDDGREERVHAGDVSVRGVMDYV